MWNIERVNRMATSSHGTFRAEGDGFPVQRREFATKGWIYPTAAAAQAHLARRLEAEQV